MRTLIALLSCLLLAACVSFDDDHFDDVEASLQGQMPDISLKKEMAIALGSGLFDLVDLLDRSDANLSEINHVRVAVYEVTPRQGYSEFSDAVFGRALDAEGSELTWERIVRVRDGVEQVWIFAGLNERRQMLEALTVFVVEDRELVAIQMDGDLGALLDYALASARDARAPRQL